MTRFGVLRIFGKQYDPRRRQEARKQYVEKDATFANDSRTPTRSTPYKPQSQKSKSNEKWGTLIR